MSQTHIQLDKNLPLAYPFYLAPVVLFCFQAYQSQFDPRHCDRATSKLAGRLVASAVARKSIDVLHGTSNSSQNMPNALCPQLKFDLSPDLVQMKAFILIDLIELKAFILAELNEREASILVNLVRVKEFIQVC